MWDRNGRLMPGRNVSQVLVNYVSLNIRQAMAVPQPGRAGRYYVFTSHREFYRNEYAVGNTTRLYLPYVVVDMHARGGLGGIVAHDSLRLPQFCAAPFHRPTLWPYRQLGGRAPYQQP